MENWTDVDGLAGSQLGNGWMLNLTFYPIKISKTLNMQDPLLSVKFILH